MKTKHSIEITADDLKAYLKDKLDLKASVSEIKVFAHNGAYGEIEPTTITLRFETGTFQREHWDR
jgi:ribosomal protein L30E